VDSLRIMEASGSAWVQSDEDLEAEPVASSTFGIIVIEEADGLGAGVRLKFTRQDATQIARFEGEGGVVVSDDAP